MQGSIRLRRHLVTVLSAVALMSCASPKTDLNRHPAATMNSYAALDPSPVRGEIRTHFARMSARYALMEQFQNEFDKNLSSNGFGSGGPLDQDAYYKLLAAWSLQQNEQEAVNDSASATFENALSGSTTLNDAQETIHLVESVSRGEGALPPGTTPDFARTVFSELRGDFAESVGKFSDRATQAVDHDSDMGAWVTSLPARVADVTQLEPKLSSVSKSDLNPALEIATSDEYADLVSEINELAPAIKAELNAVGVGRNPQSGVFAPGTGKSGNITGSNFKKGTWALTFDDGPHKSFTAAVRKNLQAHGQNATFFMLAQQVKSYPSVLTAQMEAGFDLACHSWTHSKLSSPADIAKNHSTLSREIVDAQKAEEKAIGRPIKLFRLPYGAGVNVPHIRQMIADGKMIHVFWNVDSLDWKDHNPDSIYARALSEMRANGDHGVILFHDIHPQSVIASNKVMDYLKDHGKTVCTVQGVVDEMNGKLDSCNDWRAP